MVSARRLHHTYADYLVLERSSPIKHEFCDGEIFAMAGGTPEHATLSAEVISAIKPKLAAGCRVMTSDVKVRIDQSDLSTYPDATVICGRVERDAQDENAVTNPVLVVEVTSPSSEDYDRGEKLSHYKQLPSLQTVLIVSHRTKRITVVEREGKTWRVTEFRSSEIARSTTPLLGFDVDALYAVLEDMK